MANDVYMESKFIKLMFQFLLFLISDKTTAIKCWLTVEIHVSFFALYM